jgi:hypothetical protein
MGLQNPIVEFNSHSKKSLLEVSAPIKVRDEIVKLVRAHVELVSRHCPKLHFKLPQPPKK